MPFNQDRGYLIRNTIARTVGWIATGTPILLDMREAHNVEDTLQSVKEQLRRVPSRGFGYDVLLYLSTDIDIINTLRALPVPEVDSNYEGTFGNSSQSSLFQQAHEYTGPNQNRQNRWPFLINCRGNIIDNQLTLYWNYCENIYRRDTIEMLAQNFMKVLQSLISIYRASDSGSVFSQQ